MAILRELSGSHVCRLPSSGPQLLKVWETLSYNMYINVQAVMWYYPSSLGIQLHFLSSLLRHLKQMVRLNQDFMQQYIQYNCFHETNVMFCSSKLNILLLKMHSKWTKKKKNCTISPFHFCLWSKIKFITIHVHELLKMCKQNTLNPMEVIFFRELLKHEVIFLLRPESLPSQPECIVKLWFWIPGLHIFVNFTHFFCWSSQKYPRILHFSRFFM
jgi:hypothetical protein